MPLYIDTNKCTNITAADLRYEEFVATTMMLLHINTITKENLAEVVLKFKMVTLWYKNEFYDVRNIARLLSKYVGCTTNVSPYPKQKGRNRAFDLGLEEVKHILASLAQEDEEEMEDENNESNEEA